MIVLDASVLIAHLDERDAHHSAARERLLASAEQPFGASSISIAEVLVGPVRSGRLQAAQDALRTLAVSEVPLPSGSASRLAALRAQTKRRLPDCCVLLAAQDTEAQVLTFDDRLASEAARLGLSA